MEESSVTLYSDFKAFQHADPTKGETFGSLSINTSDDVDVSMLANHTFRIDGILFVSVSQEVVHVCKKEYQTLQSNMFLADNLQIALAQCLHIEVHLGAMLVYLWHLYHPNSQQRINQLCWVEVVCSNMFPLKYCFEFKNHKSIMIF